MYYSTLVQTQITSLDHSFDVGSPSWLWSETGLSQTTSPVVEWSPDKVLLEPSEGLFADGC